MTGESRESQGAKSDYLFVGIEIAEREHASCTTFPPFCLLSNDCCSPTQPKLPPSYPWLPFSLAQQEAALSRNYGYRWVPSKQKPQSIIATVNTTAILRQIRRPSEGELRFALVYLTLPAQPRRLRHMLSHSPPLRRPARQRRGLAASTRVLRLVADAQRVRQPHGYIPET